MAAGNLYALQRWLYLHWTEKWVAAPTWAAYEARKKYQSGDYIYYKGGEPVETPTGNGWKDRKQTFSFELRSTTQGNVELMKEELCYMIDNLFYPAPFTPLSHGSEVLSYFDCNNTGDGAGDHVHDYNLGSNFTFAAAANDPAWATTGALTRKNYIVLDANDTMTNGDLFLNQVGLTIEMIIRPTTVGVGSFLDFNPAVAENDHFSIGLAATTFKPQLYSSGGPTTVAVGYIPANKWSNIMVVLDEGGHFLFINGVLVGHSATSGAFSVAAGTTSIGLTTNTLAFDISIFRASNVWRLPFDPQGLSLSLKPEQHGPGYYFADCEVIGTLSNIYVGGNY